MTPLDIGAVLMGSAAAGGFAFVIRPPLPRLARRVRPYTVAVRGSFGKPSDPQDVSRFAVVGAVAIVAGPLRTAGERIARVLESRADAVLDLKLYQAGRRNESAADFRLSQVSRGAAMALGFGGGAFVVAHTLLAVLLAALCGFVAGSARVRGRLDRAIERRSQQMELELYTVNQLLALHVRSGAGPMQAVQRVVERGTGAVVEELETVLTWVRSGQRETVAFRRAAEITPCKSAARTYQMFALAAERGSDLGRGLLAVGDDLRDVRRESLRKHAVKQRAAMLLPTIGVLAPIMLIFVAAPLPSIVLGSR